MNSLLRRELSVCECLMKEGGVKRESAKLEGVRKEEEELQGVHDGIGDNGGNTGASVRSTI